jgi:hypothetical protein
LSKAKKLAAQRDPGVIQKRRNAKSKFKKGNGRELRLLHKKR